MSMSFYLLWCTGLFLIATVAWLSCITRTVPISIPISLNTCCRNKSSPAASHNAGFPKHFPADALLASRWTPSVPYPIRTCELSQREKSDIYQSLRQLNLIARGGTHIQVQLRAGRFYILHLCQWIKTMCQNSLCHRRSTTTWGSERLLQDKISK